MRLAEPRSISLPLIAIGGCCHEDRPSGRWPAIYCSWAFLVRTRDGIAPMAAQFSSGRLRRRRRSRRYQPCLVRMAVSARAHLGSRRHGFCCPSPSPRSKNCDLACQWRSNVPNGTSMPKGVSASSGRTTAARTCSSISAVCPDGASGSIIIVQPSRRLCELELAHTGARPIPPTKESGLLHRWDDRDNPSLWPAGSVFLDGPDHA